MDLPLRTPTLVTPDELAFDTGNPRFAPQIGIRATASDQEIISLLKESADLDELLLSIASNGYVNVEPMLVIGDTKPYRVLEGNRRLAVIKLFKNASLAEACKINIPAIDPKVNSSIDKILVYRVDNEIEARAFIGFKHINGPHKWDSIAKAKYAADWYVKEGISIEEISRKIGDSFSTVRKMLLGWFVLEQAREKDLFSIEDRWPSRSFAFSHLYIGLTRGPIREYIGLPASSPGDIEINHDPIDSSHYDALKKLLQWLYGSNRDKIKPIISSQNPDLKNLAEVLSHIKAKNVLELESDLEKAYAILTPVDQLFQKSLYSAEQYAKQALANVYSYTKGQPLYETALSLKTISTDLANHMRMKKDSIEIGD